MNKQQLMLQIQETGLALFDLVLFLDAHPQNAQALDCFSDIQKQHAELQAEYEMNFGPLTASDTDATQGWTWIKAPWPWEPEA